MEDLRSPFRRWPLAAAAVLCLGVLLGMGGCTRWGPAGDAGPAEQREQGARGIHLQDVTEAAGLGGFTHRTGAFGEKWLPETMGSGGGFIDYDGDGWLDVLLVGGGRWPQQEEDGAPALWLFRNDGDGTFTLRTREAGLASVETYGFGVTAADYDNDGDEDFFLTTLYENMLFRNDGGRFTEVGRAAGVAGDSTWSSAAVFFDADRDGWLDLYVGNYVRWSPEDDVWCTVNGKDKAYCTPLLYEGVSGRFYRNDGDGTFSDRTEEAGLSGLPGKTLGVAELDVDDDGWSDLVVANDLQRDLLLMNRGDGTFTERGMASGIAFSENGAARSGMGIDAGPVDSTGRVTVFVGNFSNEMIGVYRHTGSGIFLDRAVLSGIGRPSLPTLTFGLFLFDVDLDADLDLLAANGEVRDSIESLVEGIAYRQPPQLFVNDGRGRFAELKPEAGPLAEPLVARGAAHADFDRDGDLDVLITENGGPVHLWRNDQTGGRFLRVRLEGRASNRDGLGARVVSWAGGRRSERRVRTGGSYLSQSEKTVTFGLGAAARVDTLAVYWPSGQVDRLTDVPVDREIHLVEGVPGPSL